MFHEILIFSNAVKQLHFLIRSISESFYQIQVYTRHYFGHMIIIIITVMFYD